jgi:hypothetical protein
MEDGKFTMFAGKSVALAEVFKFTLGKEIFVGPSVCRLELSAPTEESTDGGRLAVQHVSIVPDGGGAATVIATAYQVDHRAEARQYEVVAEAYKRRFRTSDFPVNPGQFDEMTRKLKAFFTQFGFTYEVLPFSAMPVRPPGGPSRTGTQSQPGAAPVAKHNTGAHGSAARTASRSAAVDGVRAGGSRLWLLILMVALATAGASGAAVYFLRQ